MTNEAKCMWFAVTKCKCMVKNSIVCDNTAYFYYLLLTGAVKDEATLSHVLYNAGAYSKGVIWARYLEGLQDMIIMWKRLLFHDEFDIFYTKESR